MAKIPKKISEAFNSDELVLQFVRDAVKDARADERERLMERLLYLLWAHPKLERDDAELICEMLKKKEEGRRT